jgi:hypothetical protein
MFRKEGKMKKVAVFMAEVASCTMGSVGDPCTRNEDKPMNTRANRFFRSRLLRDACAIVSVCLVGMLILAPVPYAFGQTFYGMTVHNNFGAGEFYNATPTNAQIWLLSNFKFDYLKSGSWTTGNATAGSWGVVSLSDIDQGRIRLYRTSGGTRMYAILSNTQPAAAQPDPSTSQPNNYFEWSFDGGGVPGTLDLSWIDRFDFLTRLEISNLPNSAPTMVYGAKQGESTAAVGAAMSGYTSQPAYAWLGTGTGGFSKTLSFPGATNPVGWVTRNQYSGSGFASGIGSLTNALDQVIATAAVSPTWPGLTSGTGPNWTTAGFRVGYPETMNDPATGTATGSAWTAYVGFTKDGSGSYAMRLTDFTLYTYNSEGSGTVSWSAVNDAGGAVYQVKQADGVLDCIWTSSWNNLVRHPSWVANLGSNGPNVLYASYNALASGIIHSSFFVNNTLLPTTGVWTGYVPRIVGVKTYNFEVFSAGAPVTNDGHNQGLGGLLNGQDMISLLDDRRLANALVNPYMLELLRTQEVTPAYLYPSQDVWAFNGIPGGSPVLGLQTGPLNGQAVFGDAATFDWYLGGGGGLQSHLYVSTDGKCGGKSPCYSSIQAAISAASTGLTILIAGGSYTESITLNESKSLTLQGNWDSTFENQNGATVLTGAPEVKQGSLTLQELTISPP